MKRILLFLIVSISAFLVSCSTAKYSGLTPKQPNTKLLTTQEMISHNPDHRLMASAKMDALKNVDQISNCEDGAALNLPKRVALNSSKKAGTSPILNNPISFLTQSVSLSNLGNKAENMVKIKTAATSEMSPKQAAEIHKTWMFIGLAGTLVFLALSILFVHGALGLIFGALLLLSFFVFLIFLALHLWEKHLARLKKKNDKK